MSERRTLTVPEAAAELGVSVRTAYAAIHAGQLKAVRLGTRRLVVPRKQLERLLGEDVERNGDGQTAA